MTNALWYALLCLLSAALFIYALYKTRDPKVLALYLFISGLTYVMEFVILVLFNSYWYRPQVLADPYFDNILGAIASDAFAVPMAAAFIGAFGLGWVGIGAVIGFLVGIEVLFLNLGIYGHFWWKVPYTGPLLLLGFYLAKYWLARLRSSLTGPVRFLTLYSASVLIQASLVFVLCAFFNAYRYNVGWFKNPTRGHIAFATAYILLRAMLFVYLVISRQPWRWTTLTVSATILLDLALWKLNILWMSAHWSLVYFPALRLGIVWVLTITDRHLLGQSQ